MPSITITVNEDGSTKGGSSSRISFDEYLDLTAVMFEWGDSYDAKDWTRLRGIIAPTLLVDYSNIGKTRWDNMSSTDFMTMITSPDFLGDPCVRTQHLLGATRWEKISETRVIGHHQIRAAHQVYTGPDLKKVKLRGHSYATNEHYYTKIDGVWKFAGLKPRVNWNEHDFEKVFKGSYVEEQKGDNGTMAGNESCGKLKTNGPGVSMSLQE